LLSFVLFSHDSVLSFFAKQSFKQKDVQKMRDLNYLWVALVISQTIQPIFPPQTSAYVKADPNNR